jgi:hypothetical protein
MVPSWKLGGGVPNPNTQVEKTVESPPDLISNLSRRSAHDRLWLGLRNFLDYRKRLFQNDIPSSKRSPQVKTITITDEWTPSEREQRKFSLEG